MRVGIYRGVQNLVVEDQPEPEPGPGDVVLDVAACGICGSDVHSFAHAAWIAEGMPMGHEFAGTVRQLGEGVEGLAVGDAVAVNPFVACRTCEHCEAGRSNLCADPSRSAAAGFADQILVHDAVVGERLFPIPAGLPVEQAALLEPLSVALRAVTQSAVGPADRVAVVGLGAIGQCVVQVLRHLGVRDIVGIDISPLRLQTASQSGAASLVDALQDNAVAAVKTLYGTSFSPFREAGRVTVLFECSGALPGVQDALSMVEAGGTVVLVALFGDAPPVDLNAVVQKELRVRGSFAYTAADAQAAFALLADGSVDMGPLITHRRPLGDLNSAFAVQMDAARSVKVLVTP